MRVGMDDIVWIAGDISSIQYTGSGPVTVNWFFDGTDRKICKWSGRHANFSGEEGNFRISQNFHLPNRNSELYF
jgi:hypothetical protein